MKRSKIILFILFTVLLLYAYNDVMTSRQAGFREQDRSSVYLYLFFIISLLTTYNIGTGNKIIIRNKPLLVILWSIISWIIIVNIINSVSLWTSIVHVSMGVWWVMSYYFFYKYSLFNPKSRKLIISFFLMMFVFYIWVNFYIRDNLLSTFSIEYSITGYAYYFIVFVPFIALIQKNKYRNIIFGIVMVLVVTSFKRGPILILPLMLFIFFLTESIMRRKVVKFFTAIIPITFLSIIVFYWINDISGSYLMSRFSAEELSSGSGRMELWTHLLYLIKQRGDLLLLIGSGSGSTVSNFGTSAHNEWLEFLFNFGLIGILLYFTMCIIMLRNYIYLLKKKSIYAPHVGMMTIYVLSVGIFSQFFFVHSTFYVFAFLGLIDSQSNKVIIKNEKSNK